MRRGARLGVSNQTISKRVRSTSVVAFIAGLSIVTGVALGWAAKTLLAPPAPMPAQQVFSVVEAADGVVSRSMRLAAQANWAGSVAVPNLAAGTVTAHRIKGAARVESGRPVYDVDLRAVSVAQGSVPAFRAMAAGANGADVRQLQQMLIDVGVRSAKPDGKFGAQTARQVRAWQRETGQQVTGQIAVGSLVFVPKLPATLVLGDGLAVGTRVSASGSGPTEPADGEASPGAASASAGAVLRVLPASPSFSIALPENQARMARAGMAVNINHDGATWPAVIDRIGEPSDEGTAVAILKSTSAAPICADQCSAIPITGAAGLDATIVVVPEAKGVVVPAAALVVGADGSAAVQMEDGTRVPVTVKASASGRSVVDGVIAGAKLRVPGAE